jgi:hypothetical protein
MQCAHLRNTLATINTIGIDVGKNTFHLVGLDKRGAIVLQQKVTRHQLGHRLGNNCFVPRHAPASLLEDTNVLLVYYFVQLRRRSQTKLQGYTGLQPSLARLLYENQTDASTLSLVRPCPEYKSWPHSNWNFGSPAKASALTFRTPWSSVSRGTATVFSANAPAFAIS